MQIVINGDIDSIIINGKEVSTKTSKNLADEFVKHEGTKEYNGVVEKIQKWYYGTLLKLPWCATALSYFANECDLSEQIGKHENVDRMKEYMEKKGTIKMSLAYKGDYIPKKGDVVFFSSKHDYKDCTHVGTVISVNGDIVEWIGGNTSDSIKRKTTNMKTDKYLVCFGEVTY